MKDDDMATDRSKIQKLQKIKLDMERRTLKIKHVCAKYYKNFNSRWNGSIYNKPGIVNSIHYLTYYYFMYHFIFRTVGWNFYFENSTYIVKDGSENRKVPKMVLKSLRHSINPRNIILEPTSRTAYCVNRAAGSATWMILFGKMHAKEKKFKSIHLHNALKYED